MKITRSTKFLLVFLLSLATAFSVNAAVNTERTKNPSPQTGLLQFVFDRAIVLHQIKKNGSGLTWDKENSHLVAVVNNPPEIHIFTADALPVQTVKLVNFSDTEAISHISGNLFAIVNERRMNIALARIESNTRIIDADELPHIRIADEITENKGIEGLTFDTSTSSFFAVKEKSPKMIYQIHMKKWSGAPCKDTGMQYDVKSAWKLPFFSYGLKDFSDIHLDADTGHFLILSDDSKTIVEVTATGKLLRRIPLKKLLKMTIPQPEGITISPEGRLYILSEPNLLYIFNPLG